MQQRRDQQTSTLQSPQTIRHWEESLYCTERQVFYLWQTHKPTHPITTIWISRRLSPLGTEVPTIQVNICPSCYQQPPSVSSLPWGRAGTPGGEESPWSASERSPWTRPSLWPCPPTSGIIALYQTHIQTPLGTGKEAENSKVLQKAFMKVIHGAQQWI